MSRGVNKVILVGRVGNDPEQRYTQNSAMVVTLSLATNDVWTDRQTNERQERTEWHRVVFFGKLAEISHEYVKKGRQIYVEGRLQTRKWQDQKTGQDRWSTEIIATDMQLLGSRDLDQGSFQGSRNDDNLQQGDFSSQSNESVKTSAGTTEKTVQSQDNLDDIPW